ERGQLGAVVERRQQVCGRQCNEIAHRRGDRRQPDREQRRIGDKGGATHERGNRPARDASDDQEQSVSEVHAGGLLADEQRRYLSPRARRLETNDQKNAWIPVCSRPRISAWSSCVPSWVLPVSRFALTRITWNSSEMPLPPCMSRASRAISSALPQLLRLSIEPGGGAALPASIMRPSRSAPASPSAISVCMSASFFWIS